MEWRRTYVLWRLQVKEPMSYEQFMGRAPVLSPEEKFADFWELIERQREKEKHGSAAS